MDYLDELCPTPRLIPAEGAARRRALTMNAAADGLLVAVVLAKGKAARPLERQWPEWQEAQRVKAQAWHGRLRRHESVATALAGGLQSRYSRLYSL